MGKQKRPEAKAQGETEKQQGEAATAKPEAPKVNGQEQPPSDKATEAATPEVDKGTADADKQKQLEADRAKADAAAKADADANTAEGKKTKAGQQPSAANRTGGGRDGARTPELRLDAKNETQAVEQLKQERVRADDEFEKAKRDAEQKPGPAGAAKATTAGP